MTAEKQTQGNFDDRFDIHAAAAGLTASAGQAVEHLLDVYQTSVGRIADTHVQTARAVDDPTLVTIAQIQASLSRDVVDAYVTSIRKLLQL